MGIWRCFGFFGPLVVLVGLLLLPNSISAEEPLSISISSSRQSCSVGTHTEVSWRITGGAAPYQLVVNGATVDPDLTSQQVLCELPEGLADPSQLYALDRTVIRATVTDAAEQRASDRLVLSLSQPLAPPRRAFASVWQGWNDYRDATLHAGVDRQSARYRSKAPPPALYLFRWRPVGSDIWSYRSQDEPTSDVYFSLDLQQDALNTKYEVQVSQLQNQIEQETPNALRWTRTMTAISHGPPNDVTVRTSSDSVEVTWSANRADTRWAVSIEESARRADGWSVSQTQEVSGRSAYSVAFVNLRPNHEYSISLRQGSIATLPEATFDVRTESERQDVSRPFGGPRITSVYPSLGSAGSVVGLVVEWDPPLIGENVRFRVYAHEFATPVDDNSFLRVDADWRQAYVGGIRPGTLYRVVVANDDLHRVYDEVLIETPIEYTDDAHAYSPAPSELLIEWRKISHNHVLQDTFLVTWEPDYRDGDAQVQWQKDGRTMNSYGGAPILIRVSRPGGYRFRARFRSQDRWTDWTPWQYRSTTPDPPHHGGIRAYEQNHQWHIEWGPVHHSLTPVHGYRVYLTYASGQEFQFDAGAESRLSIPIPTRGIPVGIQVASYHRQYGTGSRSPTVTISPGSPPELHLSRFYNDNIMCDPYSGLPAAIPWEVRGGVAPFFIAVGNREAYETSEREGIEIVPCELTPDDDEPLSESVTINLVDAHGRTSTLTRAIRHAPLYSEEQDRGLSVRQVKVFSVDEREAHLGWPCSIWGVLGFGPRPPITFLLRWRWFGSGPWQYREIETGSPGYKSGNQCRWVWPDLRPETRYEFQLAYRPFFDEGSEPKEWSTVSSFTTLEEIVYARIERTEGRVSVSWSAQPDAWLYLVRLQGRHESWWRLHRPGGEAVETAVFDDVPAGAELTVEITSPPEFQGQTLTGPGYRVFIPPH